MDKKAKKTSIAAKLKFKPTILPLITAIILMVVISLTITPLYRLAFGANVRLDGLSLGLFALMLNSAILMVSSIFGLKLAAKANNLTAAALYKTLLALSGFAAGFLIMLFIIGLINS